jgi:hypothetical protein
MKISPTRKRTSLEQFQAYDGPAMWLASLIDASLAA